MNIFSMLSSAIVVTGEINVMLLPLQTKSAFNEESKRWEERRERNV